MNRRDALISATAILFAAAAGNPSGAIESDDDYGKPYRNFTAFLMAIYNSSYAVADVIQRDKLKSFLLGIQGPLSEMHFEKLRVQDALEMTTCPGSVATIAKATKASSRLDELCELLGQRTHALEDAVTPVGYARPLVGISEGFNRLRISKMWVAEVSSYCLMSSAKQQALQQRIALSIKLVAECREALAKLIDKLVAIA